MDPTLLGGTAKDHTSERHLLSHASGIQRVDLLCVEALNETLSPIPTQRPYLCPAKLVRGEERFGAAFWDRHVDLLIATNPQLEIVQYKHCGHDPHRMMAFDEQFLRDVEDFIAKARA